MSVARCPAPPAASRAQRRRDRVPPRRGQGRAAPASRATGSPRQRLPRQRLHRLGPVAVARHVAARVGQHRLIAEHDHRAQLRQPALDRVEHGQELALDDHHGRRAVVDDVGGLLGGDRRVDEHRDAARMHHRVVRDRRLRPVPRPDRRELTRPQPGRGEAEGRVFYVVMQLPVGQRPPLTPGLPLVRHDVGHLRHRLGELGEQRRARDLGLDLGPGGGHVLGDTGPVSESHGDILTRGPAADQSPGAASWLLRDYGG